MHVELPRLVKKPGPPVEHLRVETQAELDDALSHGWMLRLQPAVPYVEPSHVFVASEPKGVELPRLLKKPGEYKRVNTKAELDAALKDGWKLRLPAVTVAARPEDAAVEVVEGGRDLHNPQAQEPIVESPDDPEPDAKRPESGVDDERGDKTVDSQDPVNLPVKKRRGRKPKVRE